jgi:hypothetical protein
LFLAVAICLFVSNDSGDYSYAVYRLGRHLPFGPVGLAADQLWTAGLLLFVVVILLFPDGRLSSRFWRWALRCFCALYIVLLAAYAVAITRALAARPLRIDAAGGLSAVDNPAGKFGTVFHVVLVLLLALSAGFIVRQVLTWRRSSGDRRQQLKWLASGAAVAIASLILGFAFGTTGTTTTVLEWIDNIFLFGLAALPVSMGVAILRYRLYEIDRIISRTLAYALVTGPLVGVYAGLVLLATRVLSVSSPVAVAASTLAAAALFNPLRRRVQRGVDRRFNRARYDADKTVAAFAGRLKTRSPWTRSVMIWPVSCTRPWNPPTYRCGSATATEAGFHRLRRQPPRSGSARHHGSSCAPDRHEVNPSQAIQLPKCDCTTRSQTRTVVPGPAS